MPKTVMIVDDEPDIRETVKAVLESKGYRIVAASSGDECLEMLKTTTPDLILMDIMMPGTPVRKVVRKIKDIKIAYLSVVRTSEAEREELISNNIVDFIQKPFDINELATRVDRLLETK